jgi:hypothetical protein
MRNFYNYFESKESFGGEIIQHFIDPFIKKPASHYNSLKAMLLPFLFGVGYGGIPRNSAGT